ncbi:MAG: family 1 glycosylhydrolase, partial [Patescibacteria group bacterium]
MSSFPKNFLWGAATSSHQVEGNNHNDWSEWEEENAIRLAKEAEQKFGHLPSWSHIREQATNPENYISGIACDHYNCFREDFDIAKKLGHNAHRFSIEWSRIEPEEGKFDEKEIEHYAQVIRALRERGIEPFVTLWHWTLPFWMRDKGGVKSKEFSKYFERYVRYVVGKLKNDVTFWMTLNEPTSVIGQAYARKEWPPQQGNLFSALRVFHVLARAHRLAYKTIHDISPRARVGFTNVLCYFEPWRKGNLLDCLSVRIAKFLVNEYFFLLTGRDTHDYIAIQQYFHNQIAFPWKNKNANKRVSDMGWELYPESLYWLLKEWGVYGKPIYITEHGLADANDINRMWYIKEVAMHIKRAYDE